MPLDHRTSVSRIGNPDAVSAAFSTPWRSSYSQSLKDPNQQRTKAFLPSSWSEHSFHKHSSTGNSDRPKVTSQDLERGRPEHKQSHFSSPLRRHKRSWNATTCKYWEFPRCMKSQHIYTKSNGARKFSLPTKEKEGFRSQRKQRTKGKSGEGTLPNPGTAHNCSQVVQAMGCVFSRARRPASHLRCSAKASLVQLYPCVRAQSPSKLFFLAWFTSNYKASPWNFKPY